MAINIHEHLTSRPAKWIINRIRKQALSMGHDLSGLTDEQLAACVAKSGSAIAKNGLSAAEAKEAFRLLASAIKNIGK